DKLIPFGGTSVDKRDTGLAYAEIVLTRLAYLEQEHHQVDKAETLYEDSIAVDPDQPVAATNLGSSSRSEVPGNAWRLVRPAPGRWRKPSSRPCSSTTRTSAPPGSLPPCWREARAPALVPDLDAERSVRRGEPRHGDTIRRGAHVVEPDFVEEVDRRRVATVLAADPELDVAPRL